MMKLRQFRRRAGAARSAVATEGVKISELPAAAAASTSDQLEINQGGVSRRATVSQIAPAHPGIEYLPYLTGSAVESTYAIQAGLDRLAALGGGILQLPSGIVPYTAMPETQVAPDEGAAFVLGPQHSNIVIRGAGKGVTILKPASNKVEGFVQNGASNLQFEGLTFDNSANGALQNQPKPTIGGPGTGVAGQGNGANCGVRQYEGVDLTVRDCAFIQFLIAIHYIGSYANMANLAGTVDTLNVDYDGCIQGILAEQPRHIRMINTRYDHGRPSINSDGSNDPGHAVYVSNRLGAYPETITVANIQGIDNYGEIVRVRKGNAVTCTNVSADSSHRGINFENCKALALSNCAIRLKDLDPADNNAVAMFIVDCGNCEISNIFLDISGSNAYAMRLLYGGAVAAWNNKRMHIHDVSIINDMTGGNVGKDWIILDNQDDMTLEHITAHVTGNVASGSVTVVNAFGCERLVIRDINKRTKGAGNPPASDRLLEFTDCTDGKIYWNRQNIDVVPTASTIIFNAAVPPALGNINMQVFRDDAMQSGTWTPVVEFSTMGTFAPVMSPDNIGTWTRIGERVWLTALIGFTTNAYTGTAGQLLIKGQPWISSVSPTQRYSGALTGHVGVNLASANPADALAVWMDNNVQHMTVRYFAGGVGGTTLGPTHFPPSTAIGLEFTIMYLAPPLP